MPVTRLQIGLFAVILSSVIGVSLYSYLDKRSLANLNSLSTTPPPANSKTYLIKMSDTGYDKLALEINQGDTVTFENTSATKYRWPASDIHPTHAIYSEFDPKKKMAPGESWSFKFEKAGIWKFHDHLAPKIIGEIKVNSDGKPEVKSTEKVEPKKTTPKASTKTQADFEKINIMATLKDSKQLTEWLNVVGPKKIMEKLLKDTNGGSIVDCHQESHTVGRLAFKIYGASAFKDGNSSCHSGYYHGAMEQLLKEKGTANLSKSINEVCDIFTTSFGRFECLHGVGHGVLAYENYDLPKAIKTCQLLKDDYTISSCYGGMFMENIVTGQGSGGSADHETEWVNKTDPHFPCNAIDQEYEVQYQCYQMQTSWILTMMSYDFNKVAPECLKARPDMIEVCYKSYGRDAAGHTLRNPQKIKELCGKIPDVQNYYYICIVGAVNVIIDFWGDFLNVQATQLCQILPDKGKNACYTTLASRLLDVFNSKEKRQEICATFEKEYQPLCINN